MVDIKKLGPVGGTISVVNVPAAMLTASNMPMRDCMAMAAMQALITAAGPIPTGCWPTYAERTAYRVADAMLAAREQK